MSTILWGSLNSGDWSIASNWFGGALPTLTDLVKIELPVPLITISTAASAEELDISAAATVDDKGSLTLAGPLAVSVGDFNLDTSGTLQWASGHTWITVYGGGEFQALGVHTLDALTLNFGVGDSTSAKVAYGTLTFGSKAAVDFNGSNSASAPSPQSMTGGALTNDGVFYATAYASVLIDATSFVNNLHIFNQSGAKFAIEAQTFSNFGTFTADGVGGSTISASTNFANSGTVDDEISLTIDTPLFVSSRGVIDVSGVGTQLIAQSSATGSGSWSGSGGILISGANDVLEFIGNQSFSQQGITVQGANASIEIAGGSLTAGETTIASGSKLTILATGMNITGGATTLGADTLVNDGAIDDSLIGGTLSFSVAELVNNGDISVGAQDEVDVKSALSGTGAFLINSNGTLEIDNSAAIGGSVVFFGSSNGELKLDAASSFDETIQFFNVNAKIDLANIVATSATWSNNILTITESGGATFTLNVAGSYAGSKFTIASDNAGGSLIQLVAPETFALTTNADSFTGNVANDTFVAVSGTLSKGDLLDGGGGTNVLQLSGGGNFALSAPKVLTDIQIVEAQEGVGSALQNICLRNGLDAEVDIASGGVGSYVVIHGAADSSIIKLGAGNDVVYVGAATETIMGGGGADVIHVTAATLGATINGGAGKSQIQVAGGGAMTMGSSIEAIAMVVLGAAATAYDFVANAIAGLVVVDQSAGADFVKAGAAGQKLTGGAGGQTFVGFGSGVTTYLDAATRFNGSHIDDYNVDDAIDISGLKYQKTTKVSFTSVSGSAGDLLVQSALGGSTTIHLEGLFGADSFFAVADGHGGTFIFDAARKV